MMQNYENLVFSGGGVKGIAFYGVIKCLRDNNLLENFKRFAGSSAGAVAAIGLACKFSPELIRQVLIETDFSNFKDDDYGVIRDSVRLINKYGWHKGDYINKWMGDSLIKAGCSPDITFKEIYDKFGTELVITGTCISTSETVYYSRGVCCDKPVREALRISMGIPLFFKAIQEDNKYYADGALISNYPIWVFNEDGSLSRDKTSPVNPKTMGAKILNDHEHKNGRQHADHIHHEISNILEFVECTIECMQAEISRLSMKKRHWYHTVGLECGEMSSINFDLTDNDKTKLIDIGCGATTEFIINHI